VQAVLHRLVLRNLDERTKKAGHSTGRSGTRLVGRWKQRTGLHPRQPGGRGQLTRTKPAPEDRCSRRSGGRG
jgi:hypothetical protein